MFVFKKCSNFTEKNVKIPIKLTEIKSSFSKGHVKLYMPLLKNCLNDLRTKMFNKINLNNWCKKYILIEILSWIVAGGILNSYIWNRHPAAIFWEIKNNI